MFEIQGNVQVPLTAHEHAQIDVISRYDQIKAHAAKFLVSGVTLLASGGVAAAQDAEKQPVVPVDHPQLERYCIDQAIYSFRSGRVGYRAPDRKGRYFNIRQNIKADAISPACDGVVEREIGVRQILGGRPNTNYSVVSRSEEGVNKTINQRGYRAWQCFKRFSQRVFVTATTDNRAERKVYNGYKSKPNC